MQFYNIVEFLRKNRRSRIRSTIRGYMHLRRNNQLGTLRDIANGFASCEFTIKSDYISSRIFGAGHRSAEVVVRQYLLERHIGVALNKVVLQSIGSNASVAYPLPPEWRKTLSSQGVRVNMLLSAILWQIYLCKQLIKAGYVLVDIIIKSICFSCKKRLEKKYSYLYGLTVTNLPRSNVKEASYDICNWYASWKDRPEEVKIIAHGVATPDLTINGLEVQQLAEPYKLLNKLTELIIIVFYGAATGWEAVFSLFRSRWWNVLMAAEAIKAHSIKICPSSRLPMDCMFHYSGSVYRPLWTYELEAKGCRIICYFYSTYEQPMLQNKEYVPQNGELGNATWPLYLVWDKFQDQQLKRNVNGKFDTKITGPIPFIASIDLDLKILPNSVAVFDIEPPRLSAAFPYSTMGDYIAAHPDFSKLFLDDIQLALDDCGLVMAFKKKREIGNKGSKKYRKIVQDISHKSNVTIIPPEFSAIQLIEQCIAVISMPFTSTALYWRERNIPSVYYDPTGWIHREDRAAHGIEILVGPDDLRKWLDNVLNFYNQKISII